ncbi:predicted protein [Plenodomus lingam JN3]|uniref:Predicted protein n=1 Tax=Leptosphaeria maculans (strain JN3 / isolate v23.1.3 / race Av1-4-5-6-7-8) TaxID=985895 RepID=E5AC04_LEPMJ|nr:predicted protein [Plenodomus lingam JN3]CBY01195.1 predicted protein [Plenodomus lingam JN3]
MTTRKRHVFYALLSAQLATSSADCITSYGRHATRELSTITSEGFDCAGLGKMMDAGQCLY